MGILNIEIERGDDITYLITVKYRGANISLTGAKLWFTVKSSTSDADNAALIALSSADSAEIEILNQTTYKGKARIYIPKASTDEMSGNYLYDIQYKSSAGKVQTPLHGDFVVLPDVTISTS